MTNTEAYENAAAQVGGITEQELAQVDAEIAAYEDGWDSFAAHKICCDNPFSPEEKAFQEFRKGWEDARREFAD